MIYVVGQCAGALFAGPASEAFGRRWGMVIGSVIILIGTAIITAAQNRGMFLGGRFVLGFGIAISTTAAPTLITELAPAHWRGRLGAAYNSQFSLLYPPAVMLKKTCYRLLLRWCHPCYGRDGRHADDEQHLVMASPPPAPDCPTCNRFDFCMVRTRVT